MECFYHAGQPAVGSCRSCLRGLCRACALDLDRGLACRTRCEAAVRALFATIDQSVALRGISTGFARGARGLWLGLGAVAFSVGAFVGVWGLSLPVFREIALLALPFLAIGGLMLRVAWNVRAAEPAGGS